MPVHQIKDCCTCGKQNTECTMMTGFDPETHAPVAGYVCIDCFNTIMKMRKENTNKGK